MPKRRLDKLSKRTDPARICQWRRQEGDIYLKSSARNPSFHRIYIRMNTPGIQTELLTRLQSTGREGMTETIAYLKGSDYYFVGYHRHRRYAGGLAGHSLEACDYALRNRGERPKDSVIISALLHDVCSAHSGAAQHIHKHRRHSIHSLREICHLQLTQEEREAILLHMHPEAAAMRTNPLARLVCRADKLNAARLVRA